MKLWVEKMPQKFIQNMMEENLLLLKELLEPLNNKIFKYMTWISKNAYIDKLDDIVNTTKTKFVDVKPSIYFDFHKENNKEVPKFKVVDNVRILEHRNIFAKGYVPNCLEEVFVIKTKVKNTVPWTYLISNFNSEEIVGTFYETELQKSNQKELKK